MNIDQTDILTRIQELKSEHSDLDEVINHLIDAGTIDELKIKRLKKRKLKLKDMINVLENAVIPDLDA